MTRLVTVAHGTRHRAGNAVAASITAAASARLGLPGIASYVELAAPLFDQVMRSRVPSVVVPLLLSTGHHARHDVRGAQALGPHPLLATAQVSRLLAAGAHPGQPVVMVAAGSRDPAAMRDLETAAGHLAGVWSGPVRWATLAGAGRRPEDVVRAGDAVSPYLLAPGHFARRCDAASAAPAVVADVIGAHPAVVELVVARAREAAVRAGDT